MTDNQSDQVPTDIIQQKRSLQSVQSKTYTQTFKERDVVHIKPDTPFDENSKKLKFHIKPQVDRAFNPTDMYLRIPIKLALAGSPANTQMAPLPERVGYHVVSNSPAELTSGFTVHARFRNPAHVHLIKKVQILPNRQNDIEIQDEEKTQLCEWMRYALQNTRVEKEHVENGLDNGAYRGLFECETPYTVALETYTQEWKQEQRDMQEAQLLFKGGIYHEFKIKLPGVWNETDVFLPSMFEFLVKIDLASDAECLLSQIWKHGSSNPKHAEQVRADATYDVVYKLDTANTELIVEYVEMEDADKENFKGTFFSMTDVQMEGYHGMNFVKSLPFKKNNGEKLVLKQDFDVIQGAVPSKFFLGLMKEQAFTGEGLTQAEPRFAFEPFNVSKIDVKLGGQSIFNEQPLDWTTSPSNNIKMFRYLSDCTRREFEYDERTNPFCRDPKSMANKWFTYIDLHKEAGTSFADVTPRLNTDISFELTFAGSLPNNKAGNNNYKICLVMIYTNMPFSTLKDGVANRWEPIQTFAPPIVKRERNTLAIRDGLR